MPSLSSKPHVLVWSHATWRKGGFLHTAPVSGHSPFLIHSPAEAPLCNGLHLLSLEL